MEVLVDMLALAEEASRMVSQEIALPPIGDITEILFLIIIF
jgi:hypothetical protein